MLFTSGAFILFLVLVFTLYWSLPRRRLQNLLLAVASYVFYAWWDPRFCALMFVHCLVDFTIARALGRVEKPGARRLLLLLSITFNLGLLQALSAAGKLKVDLVQPGGDVEDRQGRPHDLGDRARRHARIAVEPLHQQRFVHGADESVGWFEDGGPMSSLIRR